MLIDAILLAVLGYTYSWILTQPDMIFNPLYNWLNKLIGDEAKKPRMYLFKPIIGCYTCVSGQLALWSYFALYPYAETNLSYILRHAVYHAIFIGFAIYTVKFVAVLHKSVKSAQ